MKLYKRQIKPYYEDSASYYRGYNIYELEKNGKWYDEESIDVKDDKWEKLVRKKEKEFNDNEYDYDLKWKERFVPIK